MEELLVVAEMHRFVWWGARDHRVKWARKICFILLRIILAPGMILGGLSFILLPFAFATIQDPDKPLGWSEYLGVVFSGGSEAFAIGIMMIIFGVVIAGVPLPGKPGGPG
jgi:hypothetical protein